MDTKIPNQQLKTGPDFGKIFRDMAANKKIETPLDFAEKQNWSSLDVIKINDMFFASKQNDSQMFNQSHRAYDAASVKQILNYQKKHGLNNSEISKMFKLSRNTLAKWKKMDLYRNNN
ncbi:helix-turn-helix domain-containing protein [Paenimyroides aestuarii]|uniref:Helix-turn-helix domain-containing protein n=1 Tax=Paenimyroides aestuarii TaxID=2968490 RepID=A0ABY5NV93_9FLAO|nr:helix-turn-helix domain-containing protein [Paenimyroides aestuarii]UUV22354.1 helix-turn-helix domain-containing protein [Paenimyroides aestuarii]